MRYAVRQCSVRLHWLAVWRRATPGCQTTKRFQSVVARDPEITRLSQFWIPTGGIEASSSSGSGSESYSLLVRAGFVRKELPGIFQLLPLGNRVQQKLERLIAKHMRTLGASQVSLSSISTAQLWRASGRLDQRENDFFMLRDRAKTALLLAPTHEEEITKLVASVTKSYRDLPLRLFQITRKYRDELRPRQGLLRGREFVMKDLYTFDASPEAAKATYEQVRQAYGRLLDDLTVPYLVAKADSGNMGGKLSHEYHYVSSAGEDTVLTCDRCDYIANVEVAVIKYDETSAGADTNVDLPLGHWCGTDRERTVLVEVVFPLYDAGKGSQSDASQRENRINMAAVKSALPDFELDTTLEGPGALGDKHPDIKRIRLVDPRIRRHAAASGEPEVDVRIARLDGQAILLTRPTAGTPCVACKDGHLKVHTAIEIGHTFHLGTRYSEPLQAQISMPSGQVANIQMGCHGIGVSRLIGALAAVMSDTKGLNWPAVVAPFSIVVLYSDENASHIADHCQDLQGHLCHSVFSTDIDLALDDRDKTLPWKLNDADLIGYPVILIFGKRFKREKLVEVQCRRLKVKEFIPLDKVSERAGQLLQQL